MLVALALPLGGVGQANVAGPEAAPAAENDPLEPVNRVVFEFNRRLLLYTARPIAEGYRFIFPRLLRDGFRNGLENLNAPLEFGSFFLQQRSGPAVRTLARFFLNSTAGIAGTIDVARRLGIPRARTDLGITAGVWGVGEGPYVVLPILGPSTPRDAIASFSQGSVEPFNVWVQTTDYRMYAFLVRFVLGNIDLYSRRMDELDAIEESSVDFYASLRDLYRQKRRSDIRKSGGAERATETAIDYDLDLDLGESGPDTEGSSSP